MTQIPDIKGHVAPGFEPVAEAMRANVEAGNEIGAGFALVQDGETLVDIHSGWADRKKTRPWDAGTIVPVFSTGKAVAALVMAWLVDQGRIAWDTPLAKVWPDFAANGKDQVTLEMALSHQAGLPGVTSEMDPADWFDLETMEAKLAAQAPMWEPGTASGYHPISFGVLADAVARRVDEGGRTVGAILKETIAGPLGVDFQIGVPEGDHARAAEHVLPPKPPQLGEITPETEAAFMKPWSSPGRRGAAAWRSAELPAANGHGTARALADLMQGFANDGLVKGETLISPRVAREATAERIAGPDRVLPFDISYAAGVMRNRTSGWFGPEPETVGHYGFGGSCAFADPERALSGAYVMNRQMDVLVGDERAMRLIEAAYGCL